MVKTLLIDSDNLFRIGINAVKYYHNEKHVGGIYHFVNTLRRFIENYNFDKVVVFWDGENNTITRKRIYHKYKESRRKPSEESDIESFQYQKTRINQYLEEMFVRSIEVEDNESDDLIAYYCQISPTENKTIFSGDRDLLQLISDNVSVYSPNTKEFYKMGDKITLYENPIPHYNIATYKILIGDKSDNIDGIYSLGEKKLVNFFPEILDKPTTVSDILKRSEDLLRENKDSNVLKNLLSGRTKDGIFGDEFFQINEQIINLSNPLITEEAKKIVELYCRESLDPDGRGYKTLIRLMNEDGLFKFLPKYQDGWVDFIRPFLKLTRKEKRNFKQYK